MNLDFKNCNLRKNLDLRKVVETTKILVHKLFDLRKVFVRPIVRFKKEFFFQKCLFSQFEAKSLTFVPNLRFIINI